MLHYITVHYIIL